MKWLKSELSPATCPIACMDSRPIAVLLNDPSGGLLRSEVQRAGLEAFSQVMVRRARLLALTAHATEGHYEASSHLATVAGFLSLAGATETVVSAGWCYRVLEDTALPDNVLRLEVSRETHVLVQNVVLPPELGTHVRPQDQELTLGIMAAGLQDAWVTGHHGVPVSEWAKALYRTITPLSTAAHNLLALNRLMAKHLVQVSEDWLAHEVASCEVVSPSG